MSNQNPITSAAVLYNATFDAYGRRLSTLQGWSPDDLLARSDAHASMFDPSGEFAVSDAHRVCEGLFRLYNSPMRPNRSNEPSLSVGDVIEIVRSSPQGIEIEWFAVMQFGFDRIPVDATKVLPDCFARVLSSRKN